MNDLEPVYKCNEFDCPSPTHTHTDIQLQLQLPPPLEQDMPV